VSIEEIDFMVESKSQMVLLLTMIASESEIPQLLVYFIIQHTGHILKFLVALLGQPIWTAQNLDPAKFCQVT
jgi:hypothetical protein